MLKKRLRKRNGSGLISGCKAQVFLDVIFVIIITFVLAVGMIYGYMVLSQLNDDIQADDTMAQVGKDQLQSVTTDYPTWFDGLFLTMVILLIISSIITNFLIQTNPIFFIASIIILIIVLGIGVLFANTYDEIASDDTVVEFSDAFPTVNFVFENYLLILSAIGVLSAFALYARST